MTTETGLWSKVDASGDCWLWTGSYTREGYGHVNVGGTTTTAHRAIYTALVGPLPRHLELDHLCRIRACVNPDHVEPVTHAENARRARYTYLNRCANGHSEYVMRNGRRTCLGCRREAQRRWYAARKAA